MQNSGPAGFAGRQQNSSFQEINTAEEIISKPCIRADQNEPAKSYIDLWRKSARNRAS
jgi:hypothetical protein